MPHIDGRSGEVVIRIVYDGAPEAGKTTNVQQLGNLISLHRRGEAKSPGTYGDRTEFFDWLDFAGGFVDGRRVRCQLVSVPGQSALLHRRKYLLESADVVVFVADSRPDAFIESRKNFATTKRMIERLSADVSVGLILQANKQDLPNVLSPMDVGRALGADMSTAIVGSIAASGIGVMQTFVLAVRLATDRVRALLLDEAVSDLPETDENAEALYSAMLTADAAALPLSPASEIGQHTRPETDSTSTEYWESPVPPISARNLVEPSHGEDALEEITMEAERTEPIVVEFKIVSATDPTGTRPFFDVFKRKNAMDAGFQISLPHAHDIVSGHIWPPVKGRAAIALATSGNLSIPDEVQPWAPQDAMELHGTGGWILHTADRWVYETESTARHTLLATVRCLVPHLESLPEGRSLAVSRDGKHWRMWLITPRVISVVEQLVIDIEERNLALLETRIDGLLRFARGSVGSSLLSTNIPAGAASLALVGDRMLNLSLPEIVCGGEPESRVPWDDLVTLIDQLTYYHPSTREWFETKGREQLRQASENATLTGEN